MKKCLLFLLFVAYGAMAVCAQKIDRRLTALVPRTSGQARAMERTSAFSVIDTAAVKRRINVKFNSDCTIDSIYAIAHLTAGAPCPTTELEARGIRVKLVVGPIVILSMKPEKLYELEGIENIERVDADQMSHLATDRARSKTAVTAIDGTDPEAWTAAGFSGTDYYTGKGVVIGVVDRGFEFNHLSFFDSNGTSRVKQVLTGDPDYYLYTGDDIADLTTDDPTESHGTHVTGIAAGSVISSYTKRDVRGVAPEADLVLCGMSTNLAVSRIIAGIDQVFRYADEVGKPAVVNLSLGAPVGIKDETYTVSEAVRVLTQEGTKPGRVVVFAAGNYADRKMSISEQLPATGSDGYNLRTLIAGVGVPVTVDDVEYINTYYYGVELIAYTFEEKPFTCDLKVVDTATGEVYTLAEKPIYKYVDSTTAEECTDASSFFEYEIVNGKYAMMVYFGEPYFFKETGLALALFINGTEGKKLNITCNPFFNELSDGDIAGFTDGSGVLSICSESCTDAIISVGAYMSRTSWTTLTGRSADYGPGWMSIENSVGYFSSYGTDDNGINRPDILAPGVGIFSAYSGYDSYYFTEEREPIDDSPESIFDQRMTDCIIKDGTKYYYGVMEGTSMATPCVTGIIALWLQQDPTLSTIDIRNLLRITADNDEYTTNTENIPSGNLVQAGMGKINALKGMQQLALAGPTSLPVVECTPEILGTWYTLSGIQLTGKPRQKGIYLNSGKKIVVQ